MKQGARHTVSESLAYTSECVCAPGTAIRWDTGGCALHRCVLRVGICRWAKNAPRKTKKNCGNVSSPLLKWICSDPTAVVPPTYVWAVFQCPSPFESPWLWQSVNVSRSGAQHPVTTPQAAPTSCCGGGQGLILLLLLLLLLITLLLLPVLLEVQLALRKWREGLKQESTQLSPYDCVRTSVPRRSRAPWVLPGPDTDQHTPVRTPETASCSGTTASSAPPPD